MIDHIKAFFIKYKIVIYYILLSAFILPEVTVYFHRDARGNDIHGYIIAGDRFLELDDLYKDSKPAERNTWPPFFSMMAVSLSLLNKFIGKGFTKEIWYFINFFAFIYTVKLWSEFVTKKRPSFFPHNSNFNFTNKLIAMPIVIILPALQNNFFFLNINTLLLLMISLGVFHLRKNQDVKAAFYFALATSLKAIPGLFLIYFLFRKEWRLSIYITAFCLIFTLSPMLFYGYDSFIALATRWIDLSLVSNYVVVKSLPSTFNNQSMYALIEYYFAIHFNIIEPASFIAKSLHKIGAAALLMITFYHFAKEKFERNSINMLMESASMCLIMFVISPIAWRYYWVFAFPAAFVLYNQFTAKEMNKNERNIYIIWTLLLALPYFLGTKIYVLFRSIGSLFFSALLANYNLILTNKRILKLKKNTSSA